jgi:hypothetical protein
MLFKLREHHARIESENPHLSIPLLIIQYGARKRSKERHLKPIQRRRYTIN